MIVHINHLQPGQAANAGEVVAALLSLVEQGRIDLRLLSDLRIHLDWIQYRSNFREAVTVRRAADRTGEALALAEVAVDLRRIELPGLAAELDRALHVMDPDAPTEREGVWLDEWREILMTHGNVASVHVDHNVVRVRRVRIHIGDAKPSSALHLSVCRGLVLNGSL